VIYIVKGTDIRHIDPARIRARARGCRGAGAVSATILVVEE